MGGGGKIDFQIKVERESLPNLGLVGHDPMSGMQCEAFDENTVAHGSPAACRSIAALTRNACTVSATSWTRTIAAPF